MKKMLIGLAVAVTLPLAGFIFGLNRGMRLNIVDVYIVNGSNRTIMAATIQHEKGSVIAANIKSNRKERVRFYSAGRNRYSMRVTFDDNRTLYSDSSRAVHSGETLTETVNDSAITATGRQ